jgi:hypothetical protein
MNTLDVKRVSPFPKQSSLLYNPMEHRIKKVINHLADFLGADRYCHESSISLSNYQILAKKYGDAFVWRLKMRGEQLIKITTDSARTDVTEVSIHNLIFSRIYPGYKQDVPGTFKYNRFVNIRNSWDLVNSILTYLGTEGILPEGLKFYAEYDEKNKSFTGFHCIANKNYQMKEIRLSPDHNDGVIFYPGPDDALRYREIC